MRSHGRGGSLAVWILTTVLAAGVLLAPRPVWPHPGRTDSRGGHYDRKTGTYHYHTTAPGGGSSASGPSSAAPAPPAANAAPPASRSAPLGRVLSEEEVTAQDDLLFRLLEQHVAAPLRQIVPEGTKAKGKVPAAPRVQASAAEVDDVCTVASRLTSVARSYWCHDERVSTFWLYTYAAHLLLAADTLSMAVRHPPGEAALLDLATAYLKEGADCSRDFDFSQRRLGSGAENRVLPAEQGAAFGLSEDQAEAAPEQDPAAAQVAQLLAGPRYLPPPPTRLQLWLEYLPRDETNQYVRRAWQADPKVPMVNLTLSERPTLSRLRALMRTVTLKAQEITGAEKMEVEADLAGHAICRARYLRLSKSVRLDVLP